jgi:GTP 3',8-cyclase
VGDRLGRPLRDLRVSVTDRCNFRCPYYMPTTVFGRDHAFLPRAEILSFEEITRVVGAAAALGVTKVQLTGGEPLSAATWNGWSPCSPRSRGSATWP